MCTLVLAWRVFDGTPIAVGANRDEAVGRPSAPPQVLDADPRVFAPQDEEAGGTWIGYNDEGVFAAITNRQADREERTVPDRTSGDDSRPVGKRSRGLLVRDALARSSAADAGSFVRNELADREYAGFNLVIADAAEAALLEWDGVLRSTHFDPGVHVVVNAGHDAAAPKASRVREAARPTSERDVESWFDHVAEVLRDHDLDACIHGERFGTLSSSLIAVDDDRDARYWFADGRPCETDYEVVDGAERANGPSSDERREDADGHL